MFHVPPLSSGFAPHFLGVLRRFFFAGVLISPILMIVGYSDLSFPLDAPFLAYIMLLLGGPLIIGVIATTFFGGIYIIGILIDMLLKTIRKKWSREM